MPNPTSSLPLSVEERAGLRALLIEAARAFNRGAYFEAHEVIEEGLDHVPDACWNAAIGLIQVAVGYHKAHQGLIPGAAAMLERGLDKLGHYPAVLAGLDLERLRQRAAADRDLLSAGRSLFSTPPRMRFEKGG